MDIKELIKRLKGFDEDHHVELEVTAECGHLTVKCDIEDVQFKDGQCVLLGDNYY